MSFIMRPLAEDDEFAVLNLVRDLRVTQPHRVGFDWPEDVLEAEFRSCSGWGTFKGGHLTALVLYRTGPGMWEISVVATSPDYMGQGLMRSLLSHLAVVRPVGIELWLEVHFENKRAWQLYEALGFELVGERPRYYKDGGTARLYTLR